MTDSSASRDLDWEGCCNVRELGGLSTADGRRLIRGALVRADSLHKLSAAGWTALLDHGVRTVIDLRNHDERDADPDRVSRPAGLTTIALPLDGQEDREFWDPVMAGEQFGTPLYYAPHLERLPERSAAVLTAIARARAGAVVYHCVSGRDRTGQITILLLALAGVPTSAIVADYALSDVRLSPWYQSTSDPHRARRTEAFLAGRGTSAEALITELLGSLALEPTLRRGGLTPADLGALRARLLAG